ncbi:MAG TPA: PilZ domain-containing protein [Anaerolineales bacterium]|nr:PilZ domain-containing protein [Anaerolineales bacterium]
MFRKLAPKRERRRQKRRAFPSYMQFKNEHTGELVGDLADISHNGFRLEGMKPVPLDAELQFHVDMPPDVPGRGSIVITARSRWMAPHPVDPRMYVSGYEIEHIDPGDIHSFTYIFDRYGRTGPLKPTTNDYAWQG